MLLLDARAIGVAQRAAGMADRSLRRVDRFRQVGLVSRADRAALLGAIAALASPALPRMSRLRARRSRGAARVPVPRDRSAGPVRHRHQALIGRARPLVGAAPTPSSTCRSAGPSNMRACRPAMPPRLCGAMAHRRAVAAGAAGDVDLCRAHRAEPGGAHGALSERRARRRRRWRGRRAAGARLVRGARARFRRSAGWRVRPLPGPSFAAHQRGCPSSLSPHKKLAPSPARRPPKCG